MEELEISGKRYISTRRAAREHGYHSDYMGQLIRGKKVVGQKVGRAWYIEEGSLNAYLGHGQVPEPTPVVSPAAPVEAAQPAPVERLVIEEPVVEQVQPVQEVVAPESVQPAQPEVQPVQERAIYQEPYTPAAPVQNISYAEPIEQVETERRIPIHTQAPQPVGGLRYADDDTPVLPQVSRVQPQQQYAYAPVSQPVRSTSGVPYLTLSILGIAAIVASVFASNFVSATIVTEEGKAASVQYAIHW